MRTKKDKAIRQGMCTRFVQAMEQLQMTPAELARRLGYLNSTTISKLQRGETFVDVERLYLLSQLRTPDGGRIDLNWLITGKTCSEEKCDA
jgi:transcriptional regulator with XRE-family HTH domain